MPGGMVALRVGAWIETLTNSLHPPWRTSPSAWGRGSKHQGRNLALDVFEVALRVGAWIETRRVRHTGREQRRRPPRGGVDRNMKAADDAAGVDGRPPRGGVDRNLALMLPQQRQHRRPPRGGVDRNIESSSRPLAVPSRPPRGGVDRNSLRAAATPTLRVALRVGAWIETAGPVGLAEQSTVALRVGAWIETGSGRPT